jgi:hypothetical protein
LALTRLRLLLLLKQSIFHTMTKCGVGMTIEKDFKFSTGITSEPER